MENKREEFDLPEHEIYLNCAYKAPQPRTVREAGIQAIESQSNPAEIYSEDFFNTARAIRNKFSALIRCHDPDRIAIIPSVSYGIANVANNIQLKAKQKIIVLHEQFPSNVYPWLSLARKCDGTVEFIKAPETSLQPWTKWNAELLDAIDSSTAVVAIESVHWTSGAIFDLQSIRRKTNEYGALLIIDGSQSIGAIPFDVEKLNPDAVVCAGYKWLLSPYGICLAYYGPYFDHGRSIDEYWINKRNSENFEKLVHYETIDRPMAQRYNVGEHAHFILGPMMAAGLDTLLKWGREDVKLYTDILSRPLLQLLREKCLMSIENTFQASHLFGFNLTSKYDFATLKKALIQRKISISIREGFIRISPNVYNTSDDLLALQQAIDIAAK